MGCAVPSGGWNLHHAGLAVVAIARRRYHSLCPMGRFATPHDISFAIAFLADERESGFINAYS
jgi:hypothetical protein